MKTTRKEQVSTGRVGLFYSCFCCEVLLVAAEPSCCPLVGGIQQVREDVQQCFCWFLILLFLYFPKETLLDPALSHGCSLQGFHDK